ncbi:MULTISPECIES: hypothetical protein [Mesorhizobium]|nr:MULTISPECIES: hypothetical protein [Mesorhizobium]
MGVVQDGIFEMDEFALEPERSGRRRAGQPLVEPRLARVASPNRISADLR